MNTSDSQLAAPGSATWRDYLELGKPKVVSLIVFTAVVGMFLAVPGLPPLAALVFGTLGIGLAASSAAAINVANSFILSTTGSYFFKYLCFCGPESCRSCAKSKKRITNFSAQLA